jgi:2-polyprenyl-3-methyl-5-hydroxy-6-metoxy-1,4-benzoquinol methylase
MFKVRNKEKELLDQDFIPENDLFQNLRELDFINHWLGGYQVSFSALAKILKSGESVNLVDIGSGGGDTLKRIHRWVRGKAFDLQLYGVDIKPVCVDYSRTNRPDPAIHFICDDYRNVSQHVPKIDVLHASLFCHHLSDHELVDLIRFSGEQHAVLVINDLERNGLAYFLIKMLTSIFSKSYLVKNDAPLSVSRGFKKTEWIDLIRKAGATKYSVRNKWAFRHEVIIYP